MYPHLAQQYQYINKKTKEKAQMAKKKRKNAHHPMS
jgi:hypothetical protein